PTGTVLDTNAIAVSVAPGDQTDPSVAPNGAGWLVAWVDNRNADYDIYAARVDANGTVQDPSGLPIDLGGSAALPAVAFDGTNDLVVWTEEPNTSWIRGARSDAAGTVLDTGGFTIATASGGARVDYPGIAFNGTNYLVAWGGSSVEAAR